MSAARLHDAIGRWTEGTGPLYRRLAVALRGAVGRGDVPPGERLPAERSLAEALAVSRSTVVAAYDLLRRDGLVDSRQGSGTWVLERRGSAAPGKPPPPRRDVETSPLFRNLLEGSAVPVSFTTACSPGSALVSEAARDVTLAGSLVGNTSPIGLLPLGLGALREAVAGHFSARGIPTAASSVAITSGAQQAISLLASMLLRPGDSVIVEAVTYPGAIDAFAAAGARIVAAPIDDGGVRIDALRELVARHVPRVIYLIPTFHNPTGAVMGEARRIQVAQISEDQGVTVIEDEALALFDLEEAPTPAPIASYGDGPVVTLGSTSKIFWAGLRVGWLRGSEAFVRRLARHKVVADLGTSVVSQAIAARLLPMASEVAAERRRESIPRLDLMISMLRDLLPEWTFRRPAGSPFLWVRLPHGDATEFAAVAVRHGVEIVPGATLSPDGGYRDHVRLPFTLPQAEIRDGIERLAEAWASYAPAPAARAARVGVLV